MVFSNDLKEKADVSVLGSAQAALDHNSTIIGALELSEKKWVLPVQLPGVGRIQGMCWDACGDGPASFVERLKARCAAEAPISSSSEASQRDLRSQVGSALETCRHGARQHIHASRVTLAALAARAHWLAVEQLPNYAPELNDIEPDGATSRSIIFAQLPARNV